MKIRKLVITFICIISGYNNFKAFTGNNIIQFPPSITHIEIKPVIYTDPVTHNPKITFARITGKALINGKPADLAPFSGTVQFMPAINTATLPHYLKNAKLMDVSYENGVAQGHYQVAMADEKTTTTMTLSTKHAGRVYACPSPSELYVKNQWPTQYVKVQTYPYCTGLSPALCRSLSTTMYVDQSMLIKPSEISDVLDTHEYDYFHLKSETSQKDKAIYINATENRPISKALLKNVTHGTIITKDIPAVQKDSIDQSKPLRVKVMKDEKGSSSLYHSVYEANIGDRSVRSYTAVPFTLSSNNRVAGHILGFEKDPLTTHLLNDKNLPLIPPLYATRFTKDDADRVTMSCIYCEPDKQNEALVLSGELPKKVEDMYIYGKDSIIANHEYHDTPLADLYHMTDTVTITSPQPVSVLVTIE